MLKKILANSLTLSIIMSTAMTIVSADNVKQLEISQEGTQTVVISGCLGSDNAEVGVTAEVYKQGKTVSDLVSGNSDGNMDVIIYHDQTTTDSEGNYEFKFDIESGSQWITPYVGTANVKVGGTDYDYMFIDDDDWRAAVNIINNAANSDETTDDVNIYTTIRDSKFVLGLSDDDLSGINLQDLADVLRKTVKNTNLSGDERDASWLLIKKALMVEKLNESKISNLYTIDETLREFANSDIAQWYNKDYITDALKSDFTARLSSKGIESYGAYKDKLAEALILATVKNPNGVDNVKNVMTEFAVKIGIDASAAKSHVWSLLAGNDYANLTALAADFNTKNNTPAPGSGAAGGGGGGGTGGGVSSGLGSVTAPPGGSQATVTTPISRDIFDDIDSVEWAKAAIIALAEQQIINGVGNNKFNPDGNVTREQFCKIVVNAFVPDVQEAAVGFGDVDPNEWYASFIAKAFNENIVTGISADEFGVGKPITRQDMCVMIYKAALASGMDIKTDITGTFEDDSSIADYAKEAVYSLKECGAVSGMTETEFVPSGYATRAQAAKIIYYLKSGM